MLFDFRSPDGDVENGPGTFLAIGDGGGGFRKANEDERYFAIEIDEPSKVRGDHWYVPVPASRPTSGDLTLDRVGDLAWLVASHFSCALSANYDRAQDLPDGEIVLRVLNEHVTGESSIPMRVICKAADGENEYKRLTPEGRLRCLVGELQDRVSALLDTSPPEWELSALEAISGAPAEPWDWDDAEFDALRRLRVELRRLARLRRPVQGKRSDVAGGRHGQQASHERQATLDRSARIAWDRLDITERGLFFYLANEPSPRTVEIARKALGRRGLSGSRTAVDEAAKSLERSGLIHRPHGRNSGWTLTERGRHRHGRWSSLGLLDEYKKKNKV